MGFGFIEGGLFCRMCHEQGGQGAACSDRLRPGWLVETRLLPSRRREVRAAKEVPSSQALPHVPCVRCVLSLSRRNEQAHRRAAGSERAAAAAATGKGNSRQATAAAGAADRDRAREAETSRSSHFTSAKSSDRKKVRRRREIPEQTPRPSHASCFRILAH